MTFSLPLFATNSEMDRDQIITCNVGKPCWSFASSSSSHNIATTVAFMLDLLDIFVMCGLGKRVWYFVQKLPAVKHNHFRFGFHILSFAAYSSEYQQQSTPIVDVIQEHLLLFPIYIIIDPASCFYSKPPQCVHTF